MAHRIWIGLVLGLVACSGDGDGSGEGQGGRGGGTGPSKGAGCVDGDAACGMACSPAEPCAAGLYCAPDGHCLKDCVYGNPDAPSNCMTGQTCNTGGQCVAAATPFDPGNPVAFDAGALRDGSVSGPGSMICADTVVRATRVIPTVIVIVDQSSSMEEDFGGATRWNSLRDFLLETPDGLIDDLQSQVSFGFAMYSARSMEGGPLPEGECPLVTTVAPALDNFTAIEGAYRAAEPIDDTPTGDSIEKVLEDLGLVLDPDAMVTPTVFVLATDGEPDRCEELDPQTDAAKDEAIAAVQHAFQVGIRTFVISVGNEIGADHQQAIANAGLGRAMGDENAEFWVAGDDQSLRDALRQVVGSQLGCEIELQGKVTGGDPCDGHVVLNGEPLECDGVNGWELVDPEHIRLLGSACDALKTNDDIVLDVKFPCDVTIVI